MKPKRTSAGLEAAAGARPDRRRRALLKVSGAAAMLLIAPRGGLLAAAEAPPDWPARAYAAKTPEEVLALLFGRSALPESEDIAIELPAVAEDGAVVPISVRTRLPQIRSVSLIAEKNPVPLIAHFEFAPGAVGSYVATRIKLAESGHVLAVVAGAAGPFLNRRFVKVEKGGCD